MSADTTCAEFPTAIRQTISAGNDADGTLPNTTPVTADGFRTTFPASNAGGLFFWGGMREPVMVVAIRAITGDVDATINVVDLDANNVPVPGMSWRVHQRTVGDDDGGSLFMGETKILLMRKQALQIITDGASDAVTIEVIAVQASKMVR